MNILGITFLAVLLEGTLAYIVGKSDANTGPRNWIKYVALAAGVLLAIGYKVDVPTSVGLSTAWPLLNYVISGIIIGRGSNYVNDIITSFSKNKNG